MTDRLHVIIHGRVQGVGFRYSAYKEAQARHLSGWVRNRRDGSVEAEFEGEREALEALLTWCSVGPRTARVDWVDETWGKGKGGYSGIEIR